MPQIGAGSVIDPVDRSPGRAHKPEEIVAKLLQVDVLVSQGQSVAEAVRSIGVRQFTYYRWRKEFGGLKTNEVKRLKDLEKENERLRKAVSDRGLQDRARDRGGSWGGRGTRESIEAGRKVLRRLERLLPR